MWRFLCISVPLPGFHWFPPYFLTSGDGTNLFSAVECRAQPFTVTYPLLWQTCPLKNLQVVFLLSPLSNVPACFSRNISKKTTRSWFLPPPPLASGSGGVVSPVHPRPALWEWSWAEQPPAVRLSHLARTSPPDGLALGD